MLHDDGLGDELSPKLRDLLMRYLWADPIDASLGPERAEFLDWYLADLRQQHDVDLGPRLRSDNDWEHKHVLPLTLESLLRHEVEHGLQGVLVMSLAAVELVAEQRLLYLDHEKLFGHLSLSHRYVPQPASEVEALLEIHGNRHGGHWADR